MPEIHDKYREVSLVFAERPSPEAIEAYSKGKKAFKTHRANAGQTPYPMLERLAGVLELMKLKYVEVVGIPDSTVHEWVQAGIYDMPVIIAQVLDEYVAKAMERNIQPPMIGD